MGEKRILMCKIIMKKHCGTTRSTSHLNLVGRVVAHVKSEHSNAFLQEYLNKLESCFSTYTEDIRITCFCTETNSQLLRAASHRTVNSHPTLAQMNTQYILLNQGRLYTHFDHAGFLSWLISKNNHKQGFPHRKMI